MTEMLNTAVAKLASLPAEEQDRIARGLLEELPDEEMWDRRFSETQDSLSRLASEARREKAAGKATELNPENL
jgi:hypothetical protein